MWILTNDAKKISICCKCPNHIWKIREYEQVQDHHHLNMFKVNHFQVEVKMFICYLFDCLVKPLVSFTLLIFLYVLGLLKRIKNIHTSQMQPYSIVVLVGQMELK